MYFNFCQNFNLEQIFVGLLLFVMAFGYVIASPLVGRLTDKLVNHTKYMYICEFCRV